MSQAYENIDIGKKDEKMHKSKSEKKGPIPERTHWILRKMIRQRYAELCGNASEKPEASSGWPHA
jgi:hypothetical protein